MDPIEEFRALFAQAQAVDRALLPDPTAMSLATAEPDGTPSVRIVLLKGVDERGFVFYTNLTSRKGRELDGKPARRALLLLGRARHADPRRRRRRAGERRRGRRVFRIARARQPDRRVGLAPEPDAREHGRSCRAELRTSKNFMRTSRCRARRTGPDVAWCPTRIEFWHAGAYPSARAATLRARRWRMDDAPAFSVTDSVLLKRSTRP